MAKDNLKVTISFPSLGKEVRTDTDAIQKLGKVAKMLKKRRKCQHKATIAINEEGYAGVYCVYCDEQVEKEC